MIATNRQAPVIMALDRAEVSTLLRAIKGKNPDYFKTFSGITIEQLKSDLNIFNVYLTPQPNTSSSEIISALALITGISNQKQNL